MFLFLWMIDNIIYRNVDTSNLLYFVLKKKVLTSSFKFQSNMILEESMRSGFFLLAKTRYTLGSNAISSLQIPAHEHEVESLASVVSTPVVLERYDGDVMYHTVDTKFKDPVTAAPADVQDEDTVSLDSTKCDDDKNQGLRKRVTSVKGEQKVEEIHETKLKEESNQKTKGKTINRNPICWFSALPPQTLKQAQLDFKNAIQLSAQCATIQLKLRAVNKEYRRLNKIKNKLDKIENEA